MTPGSAVSWAVQSVFPLGRPNRQPSHSIMLKGESLAGMAFVGSTPYVTFGSFLFVWMTFLLWCLLEVDLMVISSLLYVGDIRVYILWCMGRLHSTFWWPRKAWYFPGIGVVRTNVLFHHFVYQLNIFNLQFFLYYIWNYSPHLDL